MLQHDYVLETSRSISAFRNPDGIRLQFFYGRLLMNRHRIMDPCLNSQIRYVRAEPVVSRQTGPCILETLDACREACQIRVAQWLRLTAKSRSATGRRRQAGFGHISLDDEFDSSVLLRT